MTTPSKTTRANGKSKAATTTKAKKTTASAVRKTAASNTAAKRKTAAKPATKTVRKSPTKAAKTIKVDQPQMISYQTRYQMIQEAAYHIAEKQNFMPDNELAHWLEAENQIDNWIQSEKIQLSA